MGVAHHKTWLEPPQHGDYPWFRIPPLESNGEYRHIFPLDCSDCVRRDECDLLGTVAIVSTNGNNPIAADYKFVAADLRRIQQCLSYKHWMACGLDSFAYQASKANLGNYVQCLSVWVINSVVGDTLTLRYHPAPHADNDTNPQRVEYSFYYYWDWDAIPPARVRVANLGTLMVGDMVEFSSNSILGNNRIYAQITDLDFASLGSGDFTITLDQTVSRAMFAKDPRYRDPLDPEYVAQTFNIAVYRYSDLEEWIVPEDNDWFYGVPHYVIYKAADYPGTGIFTLKDTAGNNCRIALPRNGTPIVDPGGLTLKQGGTIAIQKEISGTWTDITSDVIAQGRIFIEQTAAASPPWTTTAWLGGLLPPDYTPTGTNHLTGTTRIRIDYLPEATSTEHDKKNKEAILVGRCKYCRQEHNGILGHGADYEGKRYYCGLYDPSNPPTGIGQYLPGRCYMPPNRIAQCSGWQEATPFQLEGNFFDQMRFACATAYKQMMTGISHPSNYYLERVSGGVPSLLYQLGGKIESNVQMFPIVSFVNYGAWGWFDIVTHEWVGGAFVNNAVFITANHQALIAYDTSAGTEGILPAQVSGWTPKTTRYDEAADNINDEDRKMRNKPSLVSSGVIRDEGTVGAVGQAFIQRFVEKDFCLPDIEKDETKSFVDSSIEFGTWTKDGATYKIRIDIRALAPFLEDWGDAAGIKLTGEVAAITDEGGGVFKIECKLGGHRVAKTSYGYDEVVEINGGGNIVDPPVWKKIHSFYEYDKTIHGREHKAVEGDVISFDVSPGHALYGRQLMVIRCRAFEGTNEYLTSLPAATRVNFFDVPGYATLGITNTDEITAIRGWKWDVGVPGWVAMTHEEGPRPDPILVDTFWCESIGDATDSFRNLICFSNSNCKRVTGGGVVNGDTLKIEYQINGVASWLNVTYTDSTVPTGYMQWFTTDTHFQGNPTAANVYVEKDDAWDQLTVVSNAVNLTSSTVYLFLDGGDSNYKFRFHADNAGRWAKVTYAAGTFNPTGYSPGMPPYFAEDVSPGHPMNKWGGKRDVLWVAEMNSLLDTYKGILPDVIFTVRSSGIIHPDSSISVASRDIGSTPWISVPGAVYIDRGTGHIYLSNTFYNAWV